MALMGLLAGASQSLALVGRVRRRLLWLPLTTLVVWLAFPVGYLLGMLGFTLIGAPIAFVWPEVGRSPALMLVGIPVGGIAGAIGFAAAPSVASCYCLPPSQRSTARRINCFPHVSSGSQG